ncbi:MAG: hypothetical protein AAF889_10700 [Cyanobacteria bacterium P01_D01_bin.73]
MNTWIYEEPAAFANVVSGFSITLIGMFLVVLNRCLHGFFPSQPLRWQALYISLLVTGIPTGLYHGWGETPLLRTIDLGSNTVLAWISLYAVAHHRRLSPHLYFIVWTFFGLNICAIAGRFLSSGDLAFLEFRDWGGFFLSEVLLVAQGIFTVVVHLINFSTLPAPAKPLCLFSISIFVGSMILATASNQQIIWDLLPIHALWHFTGALAFLSLWMLNFVRFSVIPERSCLRSQELSLEPDRSSPPAVESSENSSN